MLLSLNRSDQQATAAYCGHFGRRQLVETYGKAYMHSEAQTYNMIRLLRFQLSGSVTDIQHEAR